MNKKNLTSIDELRKKDKLKESITVFGDRLNDLTFQRHLKDVRIFSSIKRDTMFN